LRVSLENLYPYRVAARKPHITIYDDRVLQFRLVSNVNNALTFSLTGLAASSGFVGSAVETTEVLITRRATPSDCGMGDDGSKSNVLAS
jgi:hypothetical protein